MRTWATNLAPKMGRPRLATHSYFVACRQVGKLFGYLEQNMSFLVKLNPEFSSLVLEEAKVI